MKATLMCLTKFTSFNLVFVVDFAMPNGVLGPCFADCGSRALLHWRTAQAEIGATRMIVRRLMIGQISSVGSGANSERLSLLRGLTLSIFKTRNERTLV